MWSNNRSYYLLVICGRLSCDVFFKASHYVNTKRTKKGNISRSFNNILRVWFNRPLNTVSIKWTIVIFSSESTTKGDVLLTTQWVQSPRCHIVCFEFTLHWKFKYHNNKCTGFCLWWFFTFVGMLSVLLLGVCKISIRNVVDSEVGLTINKALRSGRVRVLGMSYCSIY